MSLFYGLLCPEPLGAMPGMEWIKLPFTAPFITYFLEAGGGSLAGANRGICRQFVKINTQLIRRTSSHEQAASGRSPPKLITTASIALLCTFFFKCEIGRKGLVPSLKSCCQVQAKKQSQFFHSWHLCLKISSALSPFHSLCYARDWALSRGDFFRSVIL